MAYNESQYALCTCSAVGLSVLVAIWPATTTREI